VTTLAPKLGLLVVVTVSLMACAPPRPAGESAPGQPALQAPTGPKKIVAAIQGNPIGAYGRLDPNSSERGKAEVAVMLDSSLTLLDPNGELHPVLSEAVPSIDNGMWRVLPDGRMETTWRIRPGVTWHDGTPFTTDDLVFTLNVVRDRELPIFRHRSFSFVEGAEAQDARTITVRWNKPFIQADRMFSNDAAVPLPKHLLERPFAEDRTAFTQLSYWTTDFVGLGPYKLKEWERGSHILVQANDSYILGRPKIDEIEVRIMPDANSIVAGLLAGTIDVLLGRSISVDHVVQLRERMPNLQLQTPLTSMLVVNSQFIDPSPAVVGNLSFRRAMIYAIDRQEMVETIDYGLTPKADHFIYPTIPEYAATEAALVKYEFDPRRSQQMIEALGYAKGGDGFYRDAAGQQLRLEIRTTQGEINPKTLAAVADYLERVGIAMDQVIIPLQLVSDQKYRATFPGLIVNGGGADASNLEDFHSSQARLPENNYSGQNRARYTTPEMDSLIERYQTTIPFEPRMEIARQITRQVTENLPVLPLFFDSWPSAASARLANVQASANTGESTWNVQQWDVQ
jgi:peptide/nickel transport system substrate-binding protein